MNASLLKENSVLQGGKYRIVKVLGQGGFGITYLAHHEMLECKVAIKEFFFKEYCARDEATNQVSLGTATNQMTVERFQQKFIKEAKTIFRLRHPNIIQIHDIFTENGTAYYVMEYVEGHSLGEEVKMHGPIPEKCAIEFVSKIGDALAYIHGLSINHLDVKPNNIMLRQSDNQVILIDFGVAKQYDAETLEGTTTTPVGISHGYSPLEQYKSNGVQEFSPQSDVYSLAATLYKLLTGITPSEAIEIQEDGVDIDELKAKNVSQSTIDAIVAAMKSRKKRTQSVEEFINSLVDAQVAEPTQDQINPQQTDAEMEKQESTKSYSEEDDNSKQEDEETRVNPHPHIDIDSSISTEEITIKGQGQEHATEDELAFCIKYGLQADVDVPVDMGVSVKWCSNNLFAPSPVSVGGHFAWTMGLSKHMFDKNWHLPSVENFNELKNNCTWKWISEGEIQGYLVTSNTTNNSIFLRCAGKIDDTDIYNKDMGFYWSDCISTTPGNAYNLTIMQCCILCYQQNPCKVGRSVRLVCK